MSPSTFRYPDTCAANNGDALATLFRKCNILSRRPAAADFLAVPLCVHYSAAMLLLKRPTITSNTSHVRIFPAISRLFISKSTPGFVGIISLARNFFGHSKRQIGGSSANFPCSQLTPTPSPDASAQPRNSGSPMANYFAVVGSHAASLSSVLQSRNA